MRIFTRIAGMVTANVNDLLDDWEDPRTALRQIIGEMENSLATTLESAAKLMASDKLVQRQIAEQEWQLRHWQQQAEVAVRSGDDAAARFALRRKRDTETLQASLLSQKAETETACNRLRQQIELLQARLREARHSLGVLSARFEAAHMRKRLAMTSPDIDCDISPLSRFHALTHRVAAAEAEAEAWHELVLTTPADTCQAPDECIEQELAALKASLKS